MKIFVFGSNRLGIHRRGAAKFAMDERGALYGQGEGLQGSSYALPTKATPWVSLSLEEIQVHVNQFIKFAESHPELQFELTRVGCGLAGYTDQDIAPMFCIVPENIEMPEGW